MSDGKLEQKTAWTEPKLRDLFAGSDDVQIQIYRFGAHDASTEAMLIYSEGLCDSSLILKSVIPDLNRLGRANRLHRLQQFQRYGPLPLVEFDKGVSDEHIMDAVYQGELVLFFPETNALYKLNVSNRPERAPEESSTEISIKGPKDGFIEDVTTNIALIRKRIRSNTLCVETSIIGRRTRTKVGLLYIRDIISPDLLSEVRDRLNKIDVDGIYSISQLEEALSDVKYSLFPLLDFTGRPDYAVNGLLAGRFILVVDGNPLILIGPATFDLVMKSPEDIHFHFLYVSFVRLIRVLSFWLAVLLPGFWVSLTAFHQDQIPFRFMATIAVARLGLPLSAQMEMFLLLVLLEIFREAGVRLPNTIGQTLTVVGGFIIGDASIRAGLVSPSVVVVGSITAVTGATLVNQSLGTAVSVIRLIIFLISSVIGMYGLILSIIVLLFYMSRLRSFGVPYTSPLSPFVLKDIIKAYMRVPWSKMVSRPNLLGTTDSDRRRKKER